MIKKGKRCVYDMGNGYVQAAPFVQTIDGTIQPMAVPANLQGVGMPKSQAAGYPLLSKRNDGYLENAFDMQTAGSPFVLGENTQDQRVVSYPLSPAQPAQATREVSVTFDNSDGAAVDETVVIGDGIGLIGDELGITPPAATLVVSSPQYAAPLEILKSIAMQSRMEFLEMVVTADNISYYSSGVIRTGIAALDGSTVNLKNINFGLQNDPMNFDNTIKAFRGFKFIIAPNAGIVVNIPAGRTVSINLGVGRTGNAALFNDKESY